MTEPILICDDLYVLNFKYAIVIKNLKYNFMTAFIRPIPKQACSW